jgi:hypothetical protein
MRPSAPPLLFWKVRASTTCSRVTLPILVSTRPIGRPWSWSIGGMFAPAAGAPPPDTPGVAGLAAPGRLDDAGFAPGTPGLAPGVDVAPPGRGGTMFAGRPAPVGGAEPPTVGALGGVTFGLFAPTPGAADACGFVGRCGFGCPDPAPGVGGVTRDINASIRSRTSID